MIIDLLEISVFSYFSFSILYILLYAVSGNLYSRKFQLSSRLFHKIVVLIPGYKEDAVIINTAREALKQNYPQEKYDVVVIADSFSSKTLEVLSTLDIHLIEVSFTKSTKSKALNKAMQGLSDKYDIALILDADNLMEADFLRKINATFEQGTKAVQGHRIAKNIDTKFSVLDAISEEINNHIFRLGHRNMGISAALIGSGMAFEYPLFKSIMSTIKAVGGFDKELEFKLLKQRVVIEYLHNAYVYDEKTQQSHTFSNQRRRWISAQFHYFRHYFGSSIKELFKGNIDYFDKALQMALLPRIILLGSLGIFTLITKILTVLPVSIVLIFQWQTWCILFTVTFLILLLSIPRRYYNIRTLAALLLLPKAFFILLMTFLKLRNANKQFIHTEHIDNTKINYGLHPKEDHT